MGYKRTVVLKTALRLADAAVPDSEEGWGSEEQVDATNKFFNYVELFAPPWAFDQINSYSWGATGEEAILYALRGLAVIDTTWAGSSTPPEGYRL